MPALRRSLGSWAVNVGHRIGIVVGAAAVLVAAFFIARGSGDDGGGSSSATPVETTAREVSTTSGTPGPTGGAQAPNEEAAPEAPRVDTIRVRAGKPVGGVDTLTYTSGDTVRLRFTSDAATEVHVHGYDKELAVPAGGSATTRFKANAEGIFEVEDHHSGALLAKLEVRP